MRAWVISVMDATIHRVRGNWSMQTGDWGSTKIHCVVINEQMLMLSRLKRSYKRFFQLVTQKLSIEINSRIVVDFRSCSSILRTKFTGGIATIRYIFKNF